VWRETLLFTQRERAAREWAEAVTLAGDACAGSRAGSVAIIRWNRIASSFRKMPAHTRGMQMNRRIERQGRSAHSRLHCID
jgi:hypothetical protein